MTKDIYIYILIFGLLIVCLIIILYSTYIYKKNLESFENYSSKQVSVSTKTTDQTTFAKTDTKNDILQILGYFNTQISDDTIQELQNICYVSSFQYDSVSSNDLYQRITDDLNATSFQIKEEFIINPVYVIICKDHTIDTSPDISIGITEIPTTVWLLYTAYYVYDSDESLKLSKYKNGEGLTKLKEVFNKNVILDQKDSNKKSCNIYKINNKNKIFNNLLK